MHLRECLLMYLLENCCTRWGPSGQNRGFNIDGGLQVYISTSKAACQRLTDGRAATIINSMKPSLQRGDYDRAIQHAVVDVGLVLAGSAPKHPAGSGSIYISPGARLGIWLGILLGFAAYGWWYGS